MSIEANHAIYALFSEFIFRSKQLSKNQDEMEELSDAYLRYRDLLHHQEQLRICLIKIFGVLGIYSPDVSQKTAKLISPRELDSSEIRESLKLWEILELYLSAVDGRATVRNFRSFLFLLGFRVTPQAIDSSIKAHPELFQEGIDGEERFLMLKRAA
jgi:hypothetical protein